MSSARDAQSDFSLLRTHFTTEEAASMLGYQPGTLFKWSSQETGPIRPIRVNNRLRWAAKDIAGVLGVEVSELPRPICLTSIQPPDVQCVDGEPPSSSTPEQASKPVQAVGSPTSSRELQPPNAFSPVSNCFEQDIGELVREFDETSVAGEGSIQHRVDRLMRRK